LLLLNKHPEVSRLDEGTFLEKKTQLLFASYNEVALHMLAVLQYHQ